MNFLGFVVLETVQKMFREPSHNTQAFWLKKQVLEYQQYYMHSAVSDRELVKHM